MQLNQDAENAAFKSLHCWEGGIKPTMCQSSFLGRGGGLVGKVFPSQWSWQMAAARSGFTRLQRAPHYCYKAPLSQTQMCISTPPQKKFTNKVIPRQLGNDIAPTIPSQ